MYRKYLFAALALSLLAGCASTSETKLTRAKAATDSSRIVVDRLYIARVEAKARQLGVEVLWINPPTKRRDDGK